ncbi:3-deoxy-manno-octulosonate cytidylyltransferase [Pelagibaculum spongiae]|uniref:3-deoxy-manno-octulosonate cytidylyltransferase n=1 Tax=Pelagibaculum spongiae TaxID=2080658 RepID=A0A2V1H1X4_9GAMM|nr:3-deoxy-manno-octulosonate cytidylyltransferase [Pelagibaculum spongiae]PVZ68896.1 3-deoxy-manno-octulosonate cytidylyltransferase [Pelagibaculum spongiae]
MSFHVIIPARYASSRLPGKPLADICGQTMIERVWRQAKLSAAATVTVATDDQRIFDLVKSLGADVVMTAAGHPSGTDRLAEAIGKLGLADDAVVVNVQGDEPLIPPQVINQVAGNLKQRPDYSMSTLCEPITDIESMFNANAVKVIADKSGKAIYFSRASIPWNRDGFSSTEKSMAQDSLAARHIGIYGYRAGFVRQFIQWGACQLEMLESLEQLRAIYHGKSIHVETACAEIPPGIDSPEDLEYVRSLLS